MKQHTVIDSPYGPLTLVASDDVLCGLYMTEQRHRPPVNRHVNGFGQEILADRKTACGEQDFFGRDGLA